MDLQISQSICAVHTENPEPCFKSPLKRKQPSSIPLPVQ